MYKSELQQRLKAISKKVNSQTEYLRFFFSMYGFPPMDFEDCNNLSIEFGGKVRTQVDIPLDSPIDTNADWYYYTLLTLRGLDEARDFVTAIDEYNENFASTPKKE